MIKRISSWMRRGALVIAVISIAVLALELINLTSDTLIDPILAAVWTAVTLWGIITTAWTARDCWLERVAMLEANRRDRVLRLIADANVRRELIRVCKLVALLIVGASVLTGHSDPTINRTLIISVVVAMVLNSILDRVERRETARILHAERELKDHGYQG